MTYIRIHNNYVNIKFRKLNIFLQCPKFKERKEIQIRLRVICQKLTAKFPFSFSLLLYKKILYSTGSGNKKQHTEKQLKSIWLSKKKPLKINYQSLKTMKYTLHHQWDADCFTCGKDRLFKILINLANLGCFPESSHCTIPQDAETKSPIPFLFSLFCLPQQSQERVCQNSLPLNGTMN